MHLWLPLALSAALFGVGLYGVLARRNAVLVLVGVELMLGAVGLLLVTAGVKHADAYLAGQTLTIFLITIAAAEIAVALGLVVLAFRARGQIDVTAARGDDE
ncbi:NADH-quinone oxidoreductase subunit NuoK [Yimella sp. cx-51]|nr:NADH-quinone oxidoreductase subunit NuoK [Yimella sp. cx-51]MBD2759701.1 NADH-quinone oxidoreductase subunit NuoK [Yimella sp. cx-573]